MRFSCYIWGAIVGSLSDLLISFGILICLECKIIGKKCCLLISLPHLRYKSWFFVEFVDFFWNSEMFGMQNISKSVACWFSCHIWGAKVGSLSGLLISFGFLRCLECKNIGKSVDCYSKNWHLYMSVLICHRSVIVASFLSDLLRCLDVLREWLIYSVYVCLTFALIVSDHN